MARKGLCSIEAISEIVEKSRTGEIEKPVQGLSLGIVNLCPRCYALIDGKLVLDELGRAIVLFECSSRACGYVWGRVDK